MEFFVEEIARRMFNAIIQQGRSERNTKVYFISHIEVLSEARTQLAIVFNILLIQRWIERHVGVVAIILIERLEDIGPDAGRIFVKDQAGVRRNCDPGPDLHFGLQLAGTPACIAEIGTKCVPPRVARQDLIDQRHITSEADAVEYVVGIIRQVLEPIEHHDLICLDRPALEEDVSLTLEDRYLGQSFRYRHSRRPIHDYTQSAFCAVFAEQDDCLSKIRISERRCSDQENAFAERKRLHNSDPTARLISMQAVGRNPDTLLVERFAPVTQQIVVLGDGFVLCLGWVDLDDAKLFLISRGTMQNCASWGDNFTVTDIG